MDALVFRDHFQIESAYWLSFVHGDDERSTVAPVWHFYLVLQRGMNSISSQTAGVPNSLNIEISGLRLDKTA
jgi:hypothetical protein